MNDYLTAIDRGSQSHGSGGLNVPDNKPPTCSGACNNNCGSECACGSSNCSTACGSGVTNTGGIQRNCISFCPVINCDRE